MAKTASERERALRALPKIDEALGRADVATLAFPRWAVRSAVRSLVDERRQAILGGATGAWELPSEAVAARAKALCAPSLRRVINATGVVLHTNLGRAPTPGLALEAIADVAGGYCNLEYDVALGRRGSRHGHLRELVRDIVGAQDAAVVNNNAAATMLGLAALAEGREVIVSRGELVEIGGSFRIPDVMRLSGAVLVEVGTTNKTRIGDYAAAITDNTGLLLKVHRSNFAVVGFSEEASASEIGALGAERGVSTMYDLGSGSLLAASEMVAIGLPPEESVAAAVAAPMDLVTFSGDKLLGGPQAGVLAGTTEALEAVRRHPLMRALRPDKLTIAALGATLSAYRDGVRSAIPALAMLSAPLEELRERAAALLSRILDELRPPMGADLVPLESAVGGGAMPLATLASWGVALAGASANAIDRRLREAAVPVVGRIVDDRLVLDARTILPSELSDVVAAVASLGELQ